MLQEAVSAHASTAKNCPKYFCCAETGFWHIDYNCNHFLNMKETTLSVCPNTPPKPAPELLEELVSRAEAAFASDIHLQMQGKVRRFPFAWMA